MRLYVKITASQKKAIYHKVCETKKEGTRPRSGQIPSCAIVYSFLLLGRFLCHLRLLGCILGQPFGLAIAERDAAVERL